MRLAKIENYKNKFIKVSYNHKFTWKLVNEITGGKSKSNDTIKTMTMKDKIFNINGNREEASNVFNNYLTDVGKNLAIKFIKILF